MNPQVPKELISAYFDGEVTPEERAAVELLLSESEESQRELSETARLSALLHSFPRESAPVDLVGNVLQQTNLMALPTQSPAVAAPSSRNAWREWKAALISAVTTAAVLLVAWNVLDRSGQRHDATTSMKEPAAPGSIPLAARTRAPMESATVDGTSTVAQLDRRSNDGLSLGADAAKQSEAVENPVAEPYAVGKATDPADGPVMKKMAAKPSAALAAGTAPTQQEALSPSTNPMPSENYNSQVQLSGTQLVLPNGEFLRGLEAGNVLEFVPQPADTESNVAVVDLEVIDVERGLEGIQVFLQKHAIRRRTSNEDESKGKRDKNRSNSEELIVVFAFAPGERLAKTLEDLDQHPDLYLKWSSAPPVQIAGNPLSESVQPSKSGRGVPKGDAADKPGVVAESDASQKEVAAELAESQQAVNALVLRNSTQIVGPANSYTARAFNGPAAKSESLIQPLDKSAQNANRDLPTAADGTKGREEVAGKPVQGYEVLRIQAANLNPAMNSNLGQNSYAMKGMNQNSLENYNRRSRSMLPNSAMAEKSQNNDSANRAVKMLFVLHPSPTDPGQAAPAAPGRKQ